MSVLEILAFEPTSSERIPLYAMSVSAGLPVPVENDIDKVIDLNEFLVEHPVATFFARVKGDVLNSVGIQNDDILIVDTAIAPKDGKTVIASINNELTVKIYREVGGQVYLQSNNNQFVPKSIGSELDYEIVGIVSKVIHSL
jgi:DNA polymerase V